MEAACTSETSATSATTTLCNNPRTESASIINHCESLRSVNSPLACIEKEVGYLPEENSYRI
jgi:hypothetical protein